MLFFGHIAISLAVADACDADPLAAVAGNLLPDVADKTGAWVLKVTPAGRWLAHGLPFFTLANLVARKALPRRSARGFILGYASHFVADHYAGGRLPWLAPFARPSGRRTKRTLRWWLVYLTPEVLGLGYLTWRYGRRRA